MKHRLSKLLVVIGAVAMVSLVAIQTGHANTSVCSIPGSPNPQRIVDNNEGSKRITYDLWQSWFGYGILDIISATGGIGTWAFQTTLFVQSGGGVVDSKQAQSVNWAPHAADLVSAAPPPWPDYWFFVCGTTDPI